MIDTRFPKVERDLVNTQAMLSRDICFGVLEATSFAESSAAALPTIDLGVS